MARIQLDNVSVSFPVYDSSTRSIKNRILSNNAGGSIDNDTNKHQSTVNALEQVTETFDHGTRVGLVGHNGAGKSTLLRVLAGIYEPCSGNLLIRGHVAPLFDIALGMDHEATGYENIRLRGLFLGLSKSEIDRKTDDIIDFAELGGFLDLPVRTYSAGMLLRLAFAVSTAIEPEILLIDEGIAAGDAAFLEKANKRLHEFTNRASIIVLASHSPDLIMSMCTSVVIMERGRIIASGNPAEMLQFYADPTTSAHRAQ
ncbi:ABC transporter ATP-binding protein [Lamprobacter modestohalophilus]|uniref:Sugar ABC transporter ATP-binding protein n=1 Tax=Lamprobacter modestohalophilus TaxID=1064514 RepID=A0A9X0W653_9GAMM|nr:ABC transporter ATP-binding protein [Lamprobacter modestohalophilus]MCF7977118.1 ABC transporter ATP-binding protein [Chromatiaceae bacterium]MBK1617742.1 sugar ABC transporter ATP-binding protein [Lamprobacter modestohalophilus]MCF7994284.1 ABC transporter ATP-binding protein [Chromatiaceae bacterium]MCF8003275.1 ABC transporter ATP-binding protein [Chromatiaceae bacterium]MCF8015592.1 ABC transporter ATP-binding protein [Chromatiaceae bacterium]